MDGISEVRLQVEGAPLPTGRPSSLKAMTPGIYGNIAEERYHAGPEISVSALKQFRRAPLAAVASENERTRALHMGDVAHTLLLQPKLFDAKFCVTKLARISEREKATQAEMERAAGRELVKEADYDTARRMVDSVRGQSSLIRELLDDEALTEQSFYWTDPETGLPCRGRADVLHPGFRSVVDIKTTEDATEGAFSRSVANYLYHWQESFYRRGLPLAGGWKPEGFIFLVIEKAPPYLVGIYELDARAVALGDDMTQHYLRRWAECARAGVFPGLPADAPISLDLPAWAYSA